MPALHPHQCRHTYGCEWMNATGDLALTQDAMGHASPATTRVYAQVRPAPERLAGAMGALSYPEAPEKPRRRSDGPGLRLRAVAPAPTG